jgi:hypothetical protein
MIVGMREALSRRPVRDHETNRPEESEFSISNCLTISDSPISRRLTISDTVAADPPSWQPDTLRVAARPALRTV